MPHWVEILAVAVGSFAGVVAARQHRFDLIGVVALAITTGLGGGILRDVLLQRGTPVALTGRGLLSTAVVVGLVGAALPATIERLVRRASLGLVVLDALFLGIYATLSASKALDAGLAATPCILVGVIGGVGGAVARDVFVNEKPQLFVPGTLYALPTAIGTAAYVVLAQRGELGPWIAAPCVVGIVVLRVLSHLRGWALPEATQDVVPVDALRRRVTGERRDGGERELPR
jgi:uncharacterized membrane protein YeiH